MFNLRYVQHVKFTQNVPFAVVDALTNLIQ